MASGSTTLGDIYTIAWKEWKEYLIQRGNLRGGLVGLALVLGVFGIMVPYQSGPSWVEQPLSIVYWAWLPLFMVIGVIADSFAGERERHTLEALLATRLTDRAILLGKVAAATAYGWGFTLIAVTLGVITVNVVHGQGRLLMYPPLVAVAIVLVGLLAALLAAAAGVLVSLRAKSVRQAAQTLSIAVMVLLFVPVFGLQALPPSVQARLVSAGSSISAGTLAAGVVVVLLAVDVALLLAAMARFQRSRLLAG